MLTNNAHYTVVLKSLLDNAQTKEAIDKALSTYPLYKAKKNYDLIPTREELNKRILNHYKYREIFCDTVGRFLDELEITMCEIMPYYNERFKTVEIMADVEDPFGNVDITESFEETRTDNAKTDGSTSSNSINKNESKDNRTNNNTTTSNVNEKKKNKFSDTPQNNVENINNYLTTYTEEDNTNNANVSDNGISNGSSSSTDTANGSASSHSESEATGTTRHTFTKKGNQGVNTYAHDMNEFRTSIIDVVNEIVNDKRVAELFLLVY